MRLVSSVPVSGHTTKRSDRVRVFENVQKNVSDFDICEFQLVKNAFGGELEKKRLLR